MMKEVVFLMLLCGKLKGIYAQIVLPPGTRPIANPRDPCVEIQNITDVISLPQHKYMVLEHCLYYDIQQRNDEKFRQANSLVMLPPSDGKIQANITVVLRAATLQHVWLNDMLKDLHVRGFFQVTWLDPRLRWDEKKFKTKRLTLQTASHIWVPQIASIKHDSALTNGDFVEYKRLRTTNGGNVSAYLNFNLQTLCDVDLENYPDDVHQCCFYLQPKLFYDIVDFNVARIPITVDSQYYRKTGFDISKSWLTRGYDEEGIATFRLCLELKRSSTTLRIELTVPMAICAVLILISPLFGDYKSQMYVKLFALLLQYLCLQYLASKTSHLGMGDSTPRIFRFYEFTIATNLVSVLFTLVMSVLARKRRTLPPSNGLNRCAVLLNEFLCCFTSTNEDRQPPADSAAANYKKDWDSIFSAVHILLMIVVVLVYFIGIMAIYA